MGMPTDAHHVGEGEHDDVGVGGREGHRDGGEGEHQARAAALAGHEGRPVIGAGAGVMER